MLTRPTLSPAIHGARDYAELAKLGLNPDEVIDFSDNINPYGPHPSVLAAVEEAVTAPMLARYPDRHCLALTEAIAAGEGVPTGNILPTNGASELIQLIALAFVTPGSRHLILTPTFGEYVRVLRLMGGVITEHRATGPNLRFEAEAIAAKIRQLRPVSIWLCNPNNPTGQPWTEAELAHLFAAAPEALWVLDESYRYFVAYEGLSSFVLRPSSVVIRSLTKEQGLAGLRLGYGVAAPEIIEGLRAVQPPWSVNSLAQVAGVAALQPEVTTWRTETLTQLRQHAVRLWAELSAIGLTVLPGATSFGLVEVGDAPAFRRSLLEQDLLVRDCTSFGLPEYIRIAAQLPEENEKLVAVIKKIIKR